MTTVETHPSKEQTQEPQLRVVRVQSSGNWADFEPGYVLEILTKEAQAILDEVGVAPEDVLISGLDAADLEADKGFRRRGQRAINAVPLLELPAVMTHTNGDGRADTRNPWSFAVEDAEGEPGLVLLDKRQLVHAEDHPDFAAHYRDGTPLPADLDNTRPDDLWVTADNGPLDSTENHAVIALMHFEGNVESAEH